jgi:hypothetical protein
MTEEKFISRRATLEQRFWRFVDKKETEQCWHWKSAIGSRGYGIFWVGGKRRNEFAHRVSYRLNKGEIPQGLVVMHACDNPKCVNPHHLSIGTYSDNTKDSVRKGRAGCLRRKGYLSTSTKMHENTVMRIKLLEGVIPRSRLAHLTGINEWSIRAITEGKNWKHLGTRQALTVKADEKR